MASIKHYVDIDLNKNQLTNVSLQHLSGNPSGTGEDFEGRLFYDSANGGKVVKYHNGTEFLALSVGAGDVTGVTAGAGMTGTDLTGPVPVLNVIGGDGITVASDAVAVTAAQTTITSVTNAALVLARDAHNQIKFGTDNQIIFRVGNADNVIMKASGEIEATSLDISGNADIAGNLTGLDNVTSTNYIVGGHTIDDIDITAEFVDADAHIMSSKAIGARFAVKNADTTGTATNSVHVLVTDNESTDEENQVTFVEGAAGGGAQRGLEADGNFTYNPSSGTVTSTRFAGNFVIGGHVIDDVDIAGEFVDSAAHLLTSAAALDKFHILNADTTGTATNATNAAHVLVTDNENTDEENQLTFVEGAGGGGANRGLEADGDLTYNPSSGTLSATIFKGNIDAVNGDFDGTLEADALTVGGTNVLTGSLITTLGTISAGVWNGTVIASAYLDADTAHLTTAQTFTGSKTFGTTTKLNFRDGNSYIYSPTANDIEVVATTITLDAGSDIQLEGNTTVTGNFSVSGTLNVDGNTVTVDSTTVAIADSMLKLAKDQGADSDAVDFGFYGAYGDGTQKYAGVFRDLSATGDPFTFFDSLQAEPGATVNTSGTGYDLADISAGKITAADGFAGNVTGNASGSAGTVTSIGNLTGDVTSTNRATTIAAGAVHHAMLNDDIISGQAALTALAQDDIFAVHDTSASAVKKITYSNLEDDIFGNISTDATVAAGGALTIAADAVTYAKMQNVSATNVVLGRDSSGAGIVEEISAANLRTMINVENGATADQSKSDIDGLAITTVGTLDTGNATAIVSAASRTAAGKVERATPTEALAGTDDARYVSPLGFAALSVKFTIGDGSDNDITLTHNLGTRDVIVQMYDASDYKTIVAEVVRTDANNITINTNSAIANNDAIVLVQKIF